MKHLIFLLLLLSTTSIRADVLDEQWTTGTKLALAQCLVAETGWGNEVEKAAVAHILVKRWRLWRTSDSGRNARLVQMIRRYCAIHNPKVKSPNAWVRQLRWSSRVPKVCGANCSYRWEAVMAFVDDFASGVVPDPLPTACHWGDDSDHESRVKKGKIQPPVRELPRRVKHNGSTVALKNRYYARSW
jgi:hypothetical protein